jgi:hypothetical protein
MVTITVNAMMSIHTGVFRVIRFATFGTRILIFAVVLMVPESLAFETPHWIGYVCLNRDI